MPPMTKVSEVLRVTQPGLLATLQDFGRYGYQALGITHGGPMDERAFLWANRLLGNTYDCAQIEITLGHFKATFTRDCLFVVTGADFPLTLAGQPIKAWRVSQARAGDELTIASHGKALRCYLAVAGGFSATPVYGSVATVLRDRLGGLRGEGAPLIAGDRLSAPELMAQTLESRRPSSRLNFAVPQEPELAVVASGQWAQFARTTREQFVQQSYQVSARQDRMGIRLEGEQALTDVPRQMISEPLPLGAIQVPADGQPIVMMNDHQTLGGYPKIATLTWLSRSLLAQLPAGRRVRFRWQTLAEAQRELRQAYRFFSVVRKPSR
ncbi:allophanate hydrolase [Pseudidiomarina sediminum]|uniref:Allophanate hydrolase n=2 Tax=Pseudidiomarina sediminum TaxID=431675 RepID=A0A432Z3Z9_9GAMM|nr:allophanate hydrolase [Pseudidiomarina sediminum]